MKYGERLIKAYVNGDDLEGYDIEELENNASFMKSVILYTNDKNMYNLCSSELKSNYDFVSFIIDRYNKDYEFIDEVAINYIDLSNEHSDILSMIVKR